MTRSGAEDWDQPRLAALVAQLAKGGSTALIVQQAGIPVLAAGQIALKSSIASVRKSLISLLYGIYVGEGRFVHAPSRGGTVRLDALDGDYWKQHFVGAKRLIR